MRWRFGTGPTPGRGARRWPISRLLLRSQTGPSRSQRKDSSSNAFPFDALSGPLAASQVETEAPPPERRRSDIPIQPAPRTTRVRWGLQTLVWTYAGLAALAPNADARDRWPEASSEA